MGDMIFVFNEGPWQMEFVVGMSLESDPLRVHYVTVASFGKSSSIMDWYGWMEASFDDVFDTVFQPLRDICYGRRVWWN